jgi:hypothetical protein
MVYSSKPETRPVTESTPVEPMHFSALLDPAILQAARHIYRTYFEVHPDEVQRPIGIAIDRYSYRGKLIFGQKPVLLPKECFIPLNQIESGLL